MVVSLGITNHNAILESSYYNVWDLGKDFNMIAKVRDGGFCYMFNRYFRNIILSPQTNYKILAQPTH